MNASDCALRGMSDSLCKVQALGVAVSRNRKFCRRTTMPAKVRLESLPRETFWVLRIALYARATLVLFRAAPARFLIDNTQIGE